MKYAFGLLIALLILFVLAPIIVVVLVSFGEREVPEFPPAVWSLHWYSHALSQPIFVQSALNSAWVALLATMISAPIAVAAALAIVRCDFPGKSVVQALLLTPLFVPAIVTSLALLLALSTVGLRVVSTRLVAAHALIVLPYLIRTVLASLTRLDLTIEEAARTLGASPPRVFLHITLPLIRSGLIAGILFALIISFDNVSVSLFLVTSRTTTLPIAILNYVEYNFDPSIAAISTMLIGATAIAAVSIERTVGLRSVAGA
jgi:putative spermidine/putrescine transport system permease protein